MESAVWGPTPFWAQQGSFTEPVSIPTPAPEDQPLRCLPVNQTWLHYVLGCLDQLRQPTTWDTTDPTALSAVMHAVDDLITAVATAPRCTEMGSLSVTISAGAASGTASVTFPVAFGAAPVVVVSCANGDLIASWSAITSSGFTASLTADVPVLVDTTAVLSWIAGPSS
jgi:hypothetical protein